MASRGPEQIVGELIDLADRQDLSARARKAMVAYFHDEDPEEVDWAFTLQELHPELGAQMLCFRSGSTNVREPYIATHLRLYVFGYEVGWYELLTTFGGETIRENSEILDDHSSDGRAAALIERARGTQSDAG